MKKPSRWTGAMIAVAGALVLIAPCATAAQSVENPWLFRFRGIAAIPDESSEITTIGGEADIGDSYMPELDISYFLTKNVALELILAVTKHGVDAKGTSAGDLDLGHVWLLPPTLTLQYHFVPDGPVSPYLGAGVNYTVFFSEDPGAATSIDYDNSVAFAVQGGFDFPLNDQWGLNVDLKKVFLGSDVTVGALGTFVVADTDLDPWLFGVGFTFRP